MSTFNEGHHPRRGDGKFAEKKYGTADGVDLNGPDDEEGEESTTPVRPYDRGHPGNSGSADAPTVTRDPMTTEVPPEHRPTNQELVGQYDEIMDSTIEGDERDARLERLLHRMASGRLHPRGPGADDPKWYPGRIVTPPDGQPMSTADVIGEYDAWVHRADTLSRAGKTTEVKALNEKMRYLIGTLVVHTKADLRRGEDPFA